MTSITSDHKELAMRSSYWAIDLPGLDQEKAKQLLEEAENRGWSFGGSIVDPNKWLTRSIDQPTVRGLIDVLKPALAELAGEADPNLRPPEDSLVAAQGVLEDLQEWMAMLERVREAE
jgi:hypothetical protein